MNTNDSASPTDESQSPTIRSNEKFTRTYRRSESFPSERRTRQSFLVVWLDGNLDKSSEDFKRSQQYLARIAEPIRTFTDPQKCIDFIQEMEHEKIFMIVSGSLGQHVIPKIETWPQLEAVYVFCKNQAFHKRWAKKIPKVKDVYTKADPVFEAIETAYDEYDHRMIPMSFNGIDALFMYTQLLKEALLEIEDDDEKSISELIKYCRLHRDIDKSQIDRIEREYHQHSPIWWYTAPIFMYSTLNLGLRLMDIDIIIKMGFFIRHLHRHIEQVHREQQSNSKNAISKIFQVFRGQTLSVEQFDKLKKSKGNLMSFNSFLSTSRNRRISLKFARPKLSKSHSVGILFVMDIDPIVCDQSSIPFADVKGIGYYNNREEEVLFTTHTFFRIDQIQKFSDDHSNRLWEVHLTLIDNDNHVLNSLVSHLRQNLSPITGWSRLGHILIQLGEPAKAKYLHKTLLEQATTDEDRAYHNYQLGTACKDIGDYSEALVYYEEYLKIKSRILPENHPDLAAGFEAIGAIYENMGKYTRALSLYQGSLEIQRNSLPKDHLDLAASYNNIGTIYEDVGEYSKALLSYQQALAIETTALPSNHPQLAASYNNIGAVYNDMGKYSEALLSYKKALEIKELVLPPNHSSIATSYNNIGSVYDNMEEYSKALVSYRQALEIQKKALPSNHPSLAASYNNIGLTYENMCDYSKALLSYRQALEIRKAALPPNHPTLAASYNNIGTVYSSMGEFATALSFYERAIEIQKVALPPNHPDLAASYTNIGLAHYSTGAYLKALNFLESALAIHEKSLPENHVNIVQSKINIERVKKRL